MVRRAPTPDGVTLPGHDIDRDTDMEELHGDDRRTARAQREPMLVVPHTDVNNVAVAMYDVFSASGSHYAVDLESPTTPCTCPDMQQRNPEHGCKHVRRVRMLIDETPLPAPHEDADDYDAFLGDMVGDIEETIADLKAVLAAYRAYDA